MLTALWVIVIANAVNLIDGLDGLATGIVAIASGPRHLRTSAGLPRQVFSPTICSRSRWWRSGFKIGFLPHNLHPAWGFAGDAGALFLGLLLAASTMLIGGRGLPRCEWPDLLLLLPLFIPVFILGVPIADMAFAFIRRTARGTGFHTPDKDHVHHRLLRLGHGPRRTVAILWAWTAVLSAFLLYPLFDKKGNAVIPFGVIVLGLALYTLFHPGLRKDMNGNGSASAHEHVDAGPELTLAGPLAPTPTPTPTPTPGGGRAGAGSNGERERLGAPPLP